MALIRKAAFPPTASETETAMAHDYEYDVAISVAGEDRSHARELANMLEESRYSVFYDELETSKMWGKNLLEYLTSVYRNRSMYCVMFVSEHHKKKVWPTHERRTALARALEDEREYILPVRIDDVDIPEIEGTAYLDLREMTVADIFKTLEEKIDHDRESTAQASVKAAQSRYSFAPVEGKELVHPLIVYALLGGGYGIADGITTTRINVDRSNKSNRFSDKYEISEHNDRIWVVCANFNGNRQFFKYAHIATTPSGTIILECYYSGGGSGIFGDVGLFQWKISDLSEHEVELVIVDDIVLGDRYDGKIVYEGGALYIHPDQSRWRNGPDSLIEKRID